MVEDKDRKTYWSYILENFHATVQNWGVDLFGNLKALHWRSLSKGSDMTVVAGLKINMTPWYRYWSLEMVTGGLSGDVTVELKW